MEAKPYTAREVLNALDVISGGRVIKQPGDAMDHPFVVTKTSNLPGKAVTETPGLVCGSLGHPVARIAVAMTLTESQIELAGATGVDAIVTHHPVADAASCGGVLLRGYVGLYGLAVFELHEAFHGRHPGIGLIHGHRPFRVEIAYGGVPGNVMFVGRALPEVKTAGDILDRLAVFADLAREEDLLAWEREARGCPEMRETSLAAAPLVLNGSRADRVATILHIFPHTGFTADQLRRAKKEHPEIDTVLVSISRVKPGHELVAAAKELGLTMLAGNSHSLEILENGLPLAHALKILLPRAEVLIFRERVTSLPVERVGAPQVQEYALRMAREHLTGGKSPA